MLKILKALPNEDLIYLGDTARVPYGTRDNATINKFVIDSALHVKETRKSDCGGL